jgi:hypothetical protein
LEGKFPFFQVQNYRARIWNVTDGLLLALGTSEYSNNAGFYTASSSEVFAVFTISASKTFRIDGFSLATSSSSVAQGVNSNSGGAEIFDNVKILKTA